MGFKFHDDTPESTGSNGEFSKGFYERWEKAESEEERDALIDELGAKSGQDIRGTFDTLNTLMDIWDEMAECKPGDAKLVALHTKFARTIASLSPNQLYSIIGSGVVALSAQRKRGED